MDDATRQRLADGEACLAAALDYLKLGWSPLALCPPDHVGIGRVVKGHGSNCDSPGKRPWHTWKEFQTRAPTEEEVREWWKLVPNSNVGVALGPVSGLIRIDVEGDHGEERLAAMSAGDLPATLEFTSGRASGGRGLLYAIPPGVVLRTTFEKPAPGEELRLQAQGAQTALPPSRHPSGMVYAWKPGRSPLDIRPAAAPTWLLAALARPEGSRPATGQASTWEELFSGVDEGGRNDGMAAVVGKIICNLKSIDGTDARAAWWSAQAINERNKPPLPEAELRTIFKKMLGREAAKRAEQANRRPEQNGHAEPPAGNKKTTDPIIFRASGVTPRKVEWLMPGRIPLGKLTTFAGVGGLGKTFVLCDLTARITTGAEWPFSGGECAPQGQVLFISGEDEWDDTIVPRLMTMGADLDRVFFLKNEVQDQYFLSDVPTLDKALGQAGAGVRLVVIDPPTAFLGEVNDHRNAELRGLLSPLKTLAAKHRVAIVFNSHVNKPQGAKVEAMMRVMGSVAWVNAVRAAHMFARNPENRAERLFVPMKNNLGPELKGICYKIAVKDELASIEWLGEVDTSADDAVNQAGSKKRRVAAAEWLEEVFAQTIEVPSKEIFDRARDETRLSVDALREAKDEMGIKAYQRSDGNGTKTWYWLWSHEKRNAWAGKKRESDGQ